MLLEIFKKWSIVKMDFTGTFTAFCLTLGLFLGLGSTAYAFNEDIGVSAIVTPSVDGIYGYPQLVTVTVTNFSSDPINTNAFLVSYQVDLGATVLQRFSSGILAAGQSIDLTFTTKANVSAIGTHILVARTILDADSNSSNDQTSVTFNSQIPEQGVATVPFDVGVTSVIFPEGTTPFSTPQTINVAFKNFGTRTVNVADYSFEYRINGGPTKVTRLPLFLAVESLKTGIIPLPELVDLSQPGTYNIEVRVDNFSDLNASNNGASSTKIISPFASSTTEISEFPYTEDFENGAGDWTPFHQLNASSFVLGTPRKEYINGAASGQNAWVTGAFDFYLSGTKAQVISPIIDLRNVPYAQVSLNVAWESALGDAGAKLETSTDGGTVWTPIGTSGEPNNWYNNATVNGLNFSGSNDGWSGYITAGSSDRTYGTAGSGAAYITAGSNLGSAGYLPAKHYIQGGQKTKFRVIFGSTGSGDEGFAFDDFSITAGASLTETDALLVDANSDGIADPGDKIRFTAVINNLSANDITSLAFNDALADTNVTLDVGSVTTTAGTVSSGNTSGNTTVAVNIGTLTSSSSVTITYDVTVGVLSPSVSQVCTQGTVTSSEFSGSTNDPDTAEPADDTCRAAFDSSAAITYGGSTFSEAGANNGSISTSITATLANDTFVVSSGALSSGVHYVASNVPAGLTAVVTATSATTADITLTGNATAHANAQDISNLTIAFQNAAFTVRPASKVTGSTKSDFVVDFADPAATPTATPSATPTATPTAIPTATPTATPTPGPTIGEDVAQGVILDRNGKPVAGVVVYLTITESDGTTRRVTAITDSTGKYLFTGIGIGATYFIEPDYTGLEFVPTTAEVKFGTAVPNFLAGAISLNSSSCQTSDFGKLIVDADAKGLALFNIGTRRVNALAANARKKKTTAARDLVRELARYESKLNKRYNDLVDISQELPKLTLTCTDTAKCLSQSLTRGTGRYSRTVDQLKNTIEDAFADSNKVLGSSATATFESSVNSAHKTAKRAARRLPKTTFVCSK